MQCIKTTFGHTQVGEPIFLYHLENSSGSYVELLNYGCRIRGICVPDREGVFHDVCLGYSDLAAYEKDPFCLGAVVGRHANRIGKAAFTLNGETFALEKNDGENHLHGGSRAFAHSVFKGTRKKDQVSFYRRFLNGEDGYPGNLDVNVTYQWTEDFRLSITYEAVSDADTIFNVTNHIYFNLEGYESRSVLNHELKIYSSKITENNEESLPTGTYLSVENTPFDFREFKTIGQDIEKDHIQLKYGNGYDHNFVIDGKGFRHAAVLQSSSSGIRMACDTDQPGMQLYTGNFLDGKLGKYGEQHCFRSGVCLETQHFPNATNIPDFPSVVLKAGETFTSTTWYQFGTM